MKILFIGCVEFSKKTLQKLIDLNSQVVGVCTKEKSKFNNDFADLKPLCKKYKIPFKLVKDINSIENFNWIKSLKPDIIFCFGWSSILNKELLKLTPMGILGFHPTKLPRNRGRHPLIWALVLGLRKSASTFFFMDEGIDSGKILSQKDFDILFTDDAQILYDKVTKLALSQIEEFIPRLEKKTFKTLKQNHNLSNVWRKRCKNDGLIDFKMSSEAIYNLVRALTKPYIGAHILYKKSEVKVWKVKINKINKNNKNNNIESGKVLDINKSNILVKTYDGVIEITHHDFKKTPKIGEYL